MDLNAVLAALLLMLQHGVCSQVLNYTRAKVIINIREPSEFENDIVSSFVTEGDFASIGVLEDAEGDLCMVNNNFHLELIKQCPSKSNWVGILNIDEDDETGSEFDVDRDHDNRGNRRSPGNHQAPKSISEKVKELMLLGASALIIMAKNVKGHREFDVSQVFTKPVVLLHGVENVTKILQLFSLKYNLYVRIQKNLSYYSVAGTIGTLTLWATCGRSTSGAYHEGQGVVCMGRNQVTGKSFEEYLTALVWNVLFLCGVALVISVYLRASDNFGRTVTEAEAHSSDHAKRVLARMSVQIYRSRGRVSCKKARKSLENYSEVHCTRHKTVLDHCAICLGGFFPKQKLRVLPCMHAYHLNCADRWLLINFTCPMCKYNILGMKEL